MATFLVPSLALAALMAPVGLASLSPSPAPQAPAHMAVLSQAVVGSEVPAGVSTRPMPGFESYEFATVGGHDVVIDTATRKVIEIY